MATPFAAIASSFERWAMSSIDICPYSGESGGGMTTFPPSLLMSPISFGKGGSKDSRALSRITGPNKPEAFKILRTTLLLLETCITYVVSV